MLRIGGQFDRIIYCIMAGNFGMQKPIGSAPNACDKTFNNGKSFIAAIQTGFERAWSSIRDSNFSSLITCTILWFFGNSMIRGFALLLGIGILVSMFTAITVTRSFIQTLTGTRFSKSHFLLGTKEIKIVNK